MQLVTQTDCIARLYGEAKCVEMLGAAGFDAIDLSFFDMQKDDNIWCKEEWRGYADEVKKAAQKCGVSFWQAHAPFPSSKPAGEEEYNKVIIKKILRSMEIASYFGVKIIVVHPKQHLPYVSNAAELKRQNIEFYKNLIPYCEKFNIKVAIENMWQYDAKRGCIVDSVCAAPQEFCDYIDEINSPWIVACLDIGHTALTGHAQDEFIHALGHDRLQALHVHDVDYKSDCHTAPFTRNLDWGIVTQALADIDYAGNFTFEADEFFKHYPEELLPDAAVLLEKTGRYLIAQIESKRR